MIICWLFLNTLLSSCITSSNDASVIISPSPATRLAVTATTSKIATPTQFVKPTQVPISTPTRTASDQPSKLAELPITELHIRLKNSRGEPVPFSKAELLVSAWNVAFSIPLEVDRNLLVLPFEEKKANELWLQDMFATDYPHAYFLYLEAEGYAPVRSKWFYFVGGYLWMSDRIIDEPIIEFPDGTNLKILEGERQEIELTLRRREERYLRFIDDNQKPIPGVKVKSSMFWSDTSRCGYPQGAELLTEGISDEEGRVTIPDGEFEYLLEFEKPQYHLKESANYDPMRLINYISAQETVVELHKLNKQPLEMFVQKQGKPQADMTLFGQWIGCVCGLCEQELAVTDKNGRISLDEFYPEEWEFIFFLEGNQFGAGFAWQEYPKEFSEKEVLEIELSE